MRLASKLSIATFDLFMVKLGLTRTDWEEVEYRYKAHDVMAIKFMALHKWRANNMATHSRPTLGNMLDALTGIDVNHHYLCQVCYYV